MDEFTFCLCRRAVTPVTAELGEKPWALFNGGREETLWYYRALVAAYRQAGTSELVEELDRTVTEIERLSAKVS
jgi:hypothetical protein